MAECETCGQELPEEEGTSELLSCCECGTSGTADEGYVNDAGVWRCDDCMASHDESSW